MNNEKNAWDKQAADKDTEMEDVQEINQDGWPAWQQVRQSKRIKVVGVSHLKLDDQTQNKKNKEMGMEGLLKDELKEQMIHGAEVMKMTALFFHTQDRKTCSQEKRQLVPFVG